MSPSLNHLFQFLSLTLLLLCIGCGKTVECILSGDNTSGHVNFGDYHPIEKGAAIRVEYSTDNFATVGGGKSVQNIQGLITVPYSICAPKDQGFVLRAYQDSNKNDALDSGEASGRHDGTTNGDASFISETVTSSKNPKLEEIDITIDKP